jgi:hypothetical protein
MAPGSVPDNPTVCWLPSAGADRSICGSGTTNWMYPNGGYLITEEVGPDGKIRVTFRTLALLPGPLVVRGAVSAGQTRFPIPLSIRACGSPAHGLPMIF